MSKRFAYFFIIFCLILTLLNLKLTASNRLFDPLVDVTDLVKKFYVTEVDEAKLVAGAINGMLHELDPYSEYIPAEELEEFTAHTSGSYEGIGIGLDIKEGYLVVISPFEHSPAYRAGVRAGDIILEVDGKSTKGWSDTRAVKEIKGPAGTTVKLKVLHEDGSEETLEITRQEIHVPTIRGWRRNFEDGTWDYMLDGDVGIGYVRITQFTGNTSSDFTAIVEQLREQGMQAMILDMRLNPGGLMSAATEVADCFIEEGVIVSTKGAHTRRESIEATSEGTFPRFHLVVLIDEGSASASEIVAGALQDHGRAVIVGNRSWGKGSVQRIIQLPASGAQLKLTTDYYYLPNGRCVHRKPDSEVWGVEPDVVESINPDEIIELRALMEELMLMSPVEEEPAVKGDIETSDDVERFETEPLSDSKMMARLLELDDQLAQAVKQCRGLIRMQPDLKTLTDLVLDNGLDAAEKKAKKE